jgi:hypothetical protein
MHNLRAAPEPAPDAGLPPRRLTAAHTAEQIRQTSMFDPNDDAQRGQQTDSHVTDDGALTGPRELISWTNNRGQGTATTAVGAAGGNRSLLGSF